MNRTKYRQATRFVGLAAAALLAGAASLAQAQATFTSEYWNTAGPAAWSGTANWTPSSYTTFPGSVPYSAWWYGASVITGGTATIGRGDSVTDSSGNGMLFMGGDSAYVGGTGGNGYATMTGGTLNGPAGKEMQKFLASGRAAESSPNPAASTCRM